MAGRSVRAARPIAGRLRRRWGPARIAGLAVFALVWLPPVVEAVRNRPNNLQLMWDFFTSAHSGAPLHQALQIAGDALTIMPFGNHDYVLALNRGAGELAVGAVILVVGMVAAVLLGRRRRQPVSVARWRLPVASGRSSAPSPSCSRPGRSTSGSQSGWDTCRSASCWRSASQSWLRATGSGRFPGAPVELCVAGALVLAALTIQSDLRMGPISTTTGSGPWPGDDAATPAGKAQTVRDTLTLSRAAEGVLQPTDRQVNIDVGTPSFWPYVAGMVLELDEHGVQSTVSPSSWTLYFGGERAPGRPVSARFELYAAGDTAAARAAPGAVIAEIDGAVLTYQRTSG